MSNTLKFGNGEWYGKEGTILAYNDENNNYKPLPFTFDRASSATRVNKQGLIETVGADQPRIDYLNDSNGALLLEPSRTNYVKHSESIDSWSTGFSSLSPNAVTANYEQGPYSNTNADRVQLTINPSNTVSQIFQVLPLPSGVHTASVWLKSLSGTPTISIIDGYNTVGSFKLVTLTNEWVRHTLTFTATSSDFIPQFLLINGTTSSSADFLAYGFQVEQGSYATSYIPTSGSAVTRLAETCSQTVPDGVIGQTEGTILVDFNFDGDISGNRSVAVLSSGGSADFVASFIFNNLFYARIRANNGSSFDVTKSNLTSGNHKIAIAYASNDLTFYLDGNIVGQNTSASVSFGSELSTIKIGEGTSGTAELGGLVSKTSLYNTRLSNAELAALTQV